MFWLALIISYVIGSISPAYFLGRLIKHKDIRKVGRKNLGATNTYISVGHAAGIFTGFFDVIKGVIAFWISFLLMQQFGFSMNWVFVCGFMAIIGHDWPFYLQFRGGRGGAVSYGLLILSYVYLINQYLLNSWVFIGLLLITGILAKIFKGPKIPFFIMAPIFVGTIIYFVGFIDWTWFIIALAIYQLLATTITYYEKKHLKKRMKH